MVKKNPPKKHLLKKQV